ncbi:polynucleotide kinase-phosphatase [Shimazuella kribbensis]|uniref:polynucleotide kinase-phosphatase n=1 Tax=Shimazuella kribbensis TaxID=139808 RepID=UPI000411947C|nr:polynucleotide kinase-phosphatase [Shimazuella kribbensis]
MTRKMMLPYAGIVLMMGPSSSGKTTLLDRLIAEGILMPSEVISSDQFRTLLSDTIFMDWKGHPKDEADVLFDTYQHISKEAFEAMDFMVEKRCQLNKLTIVDATHLQSSDRLRYVQLARKHHVSISVIAIEASEQQLLEWDETREHSRGKKRIRQQQQVFKRQIRYLKKEGYSAQYVLKAEELASTSFERKANRMLLDIGEGLDIIGDIHGCFDEFMDLLVRLGYEKNEEDFYVHPQGRKIVSLGDVMSRGPKSLDTMEFFYRHIQAGLAYMIDSNHGWKIARWLDGRKVKMQHGDEKLAAEFEQFEAVHGEEKARDKKEAYRQMLLKAPSHYVLQKNDIPVAVVVHAGIKDEFIGKHDQVISDFCRYGEVEGFDKQGKPMRKDWFQQHQNSQLIIWGHDPKPQAIFIKNTVNIDQGVVFGGNLTAFRFPEKEFVQVPAQQDYADAKDNPLHIWEEQRLTPPNIMGLIDGYSVQVEQYGEIKVPGKMVKTALDDLSHFTIPLEELTYIPPTMSPTPQVSKLSTYLEHPAEAFAYYRSNEVNKMVVEKKHMGSRAVLLVFRDEESAEKYIGRKIEGVIYTRTGRPFFQKQLGKEVLQKLQHDLKPYFAKYQTEFILLDAEILPWNLKAKELIQKQYAHVGEMAWLDRMKRKEKLEKAESNGQAIQTWLDETNEQLQHTASFRKSFQQYIWETTGIEGIQIAPFHILAQSGLTFFDQTHIWHMEKAQELSNYSSMIIETAYRVVDNEQSEQEAIAWWEEMTRDGQEGFVVKPLNFVERNEKGQMVQPAIKVRGVEYLHIIYGMDYLHPANLERLKQRSTNKKQKKALREFALGMEGIQRFVNRESLGRIHECVLGTLAMEADPVDPRL